MGMPKATLSFCIVVSLVLAAYPSQAYVGPGAGLGAVAVALGIVVSVVMAFFAILWYPAKRLLKNRRKARQVAEEAQPQRTGDSS